MIVPDVPVEAQQLGRARERTCALAGVFVCLVGAGTVVAQNARRRREAKGDATRVRSGMLSERRASVGEARRSIPLGPVTADARRAARIRCGPSPAPRDVFGAHAAQDLHCVEELVVGLGATLRAVTRCSA